ncbi:MAG: outer membrane beta-barrel protein [Hyphomicrobiaceae bacterium]
MRRLFSIAATAVISTFLAGNSQAADFGGLKDDVPYAAPYIWSGFYIGGDLGGAITRNANVSDACSPYPFCNQRPAFSDVDSSGVIGGVHIGYNWAASPGFVIGIEGDFKWTNLGESSVATNINAAGAVLGPVGHTWSADVNWLASVRGRLGFNLTPMALIYFTGGVAWKDADYTAREVFTNSSASTSFSNTDTGYVLGAGLEWALDSHWLLRTEYLFYNFDGVSASTPHTTVFAPPVTANASWDNSDIHSFNVGLSYKF